MNKKQRANINEVINERIYTTAMLSVICIVFGYLSFKLFNSSVEANLFINGCLFMVTIILTFACFIGIWITFLDPEFTRW